MATKKKELLEQDAPVTETVMSEDETLLADTAQPESLPAAAGDGRVHGLELCAPVPFAGHICADGEL